MEDTCCSGLAVFIFSKMTPDFGENQTFLNIRVYIGSKDAMGYDNRRVSTHFTQTQKDNCLAFTHTVRNPGRGPCETL